MANSTVYPFGPDGQLPAGIGIVNDLVTGGADKALSAEAGKRLNQDIFYGGGSDSGTISKSDYTPTGKIISNDEYTTMYNYDSYLIPLQTGVTYTLTFSNGIGAYSVVLDSQEVAGESANYADGYSGVILTTQGQVVTLQGKTGQYLYLRDDTASGGRVFPAITTVAGIPAFVMREEFDPATFAQMASVMPVGQSYPPGREDVPVSSVSFYNRVPDGSANARRVISKTIPLPSTASGFHITCASGYLVIVYYLRADGSWDSSVQSSGSFAQTADVGAPQYQSAGIWIYFRNTGDTNLSPADVAANITSMYFDVADTFFLPVASKEMAQKSISILFIGNSLTQDSVSYLPYLLKNLYPNLSFRFYVWYNGGYTLAQQYAKFTGDQACEIFSVCENSISWQNYNNTVTMSSILAAYKFDMVCLQEYFNYKSTYEEADLADFNNCLSYIRDNYDYGFKVATLFHAPLRSSAASVFALTKSGNELILKKTDAETLIAPGVAVYRALSTSLDNLGDSGHLSPDGTHTQEGLPCLLQAFVVFRWLMRELAIPLSIVNCPLRMTTSIYNSINVPGPNLGSGVIEGTDSENALAQDVAVLADKEGRGIEMGAFINM